MSKPSVIEPEASSPSQGHEKATVVHHAEVSRASWLVSALTLLSRILGLIRDKGLALFFGSRPWILDAFVLAFTIPNLFRRLFGEGALSLAFLPVFVEKHEKEGKSAATKLASATLTLLVLVTGLLAAIGMLLTFLAVIILTPGKETSLLLKLLAIMLPFLSLVCVSAILAGMLQGLRCFALPASLSILQNLGFLAAFGWIAWPFWPTASNLSIYQKLQTAARAMTEGEALGAIHTLAWGVVLSGLVMVIVPWISLVGRGLWIRPLFTLREFGVDAVLKALGTTAFGMAVFQLNVLLDNLIAYGISRTWSEGATTYLYFGNRLMQLPLGIFSASVATTVFPYLASNAAKGELEILLDRLQHAIRFLVFLMLPAGMGLAVLADPIVRLIYQEPDLLFSHAAVYRTSAVLACYSVGLVFISLQMLLGRVFYAQRDYATPVRIAVAMVGVNLCLNLLLIHAPDLYRRWGHVTIEGLPENWPLAEVGLALATTLTAILHLALLWKKLGVRIRQSAGDRIWDTFVGSLGWPLGRMILASLLMGVLVYFTKGSIPWEPEFPARLMRASACVIVGILGYYIFCMVIPVPEWEEFFGTQRPEKPSEGREAS